MFLYPFAKAFEGDEDEVYVITITDKLSGCYNSGNAPVTQTMRALFTATGAFEALTESKYLTTDQYLHRGDILVYEPGHTAMVLTDGELVTPKEEDDMTYEQFCDYMAQYRKDLQARDGSDWSQADREWAVTSGLIQGGADGTIMWQDFLTREQFATVLHRAMVMDHGK